MSNWFRRLWHLINRSRRERELVREMQDHRQSMQDPSRFGNTLRLIEESRDAWGWNWLDEAMQDLAVGIRTLRRSPSFAVTATLILAFGIGINVTLLQMMQVGLLRPPAIKDADSWVRFLRSAPESTTTAVPYPLAEFVRDHNSVLAAVIVESSGNVAWGRDAADQIGASFVSTNWFSELGYGAVHGRMFADSLDAISDVPSVVLGYTFWHNRLGAAPNLVGTTAYIDRKPVQDHRHRAGCDSRSRARRARRLHSHPAARVFLSGEHTPAGLDCTAASRCTAGCAMASRLTWRAKRFARRCRRWRRSGRK